MNRWPQLDDLGWPKKWSALHLYLQIAGKYRLAHTPWRHFDLQTATPNEIDSLVESCG